MTSPRAGPITPTWSAQFCCSPTVAPIVASPKRSYPTHLRFRITESLNDSLRAIGDDVDHHHHHYHHHHHHRNLIVNALDTELRLLRTKSLAPTVFTFGFGSAPDANMLTYAPLSRPFWFRSLLERERGSYARVCRVVCRVVSCVVAHDSKIAEMGNGLYYAIEAAEAIPTAFADCLGGLLSVCAENIRLKLEALFLLLFFFSFFFFSSSVVLAWPYALGKRAGVGHWRDDQQDLRQPERGGALSAQVLFHPSGRHLLRRGAPQRPRACVSCVVCVVRRVVCPRLTASPRLCARRHEMCCSP
jgi:hypothetical protein